MIKHSLVLLLFIFHCLLLLLQHANGAEESMKLEMQLIHKNLTSRHGIIQALISVDSMRTRSWQYKNSSDHQRRLGASGFEMSIASGALDMGSALYLVDMKVGTPPQKLLMVPDTGSDLIWVNCNPKIRSATLKPLPTFRPNKSRSLSYVPCKSRDCRAVSQLMPSTACYGSKICKYRQDYMDGTSTSGPYIRETLTLKPSNAKAKALKATRVWMGCGMENQPAQSSASSGGVLGLGQVFTSFTQQTLPLYGGKFSFCLRNYLEPASVKNSLVFGDILQQSSKLLKKPVQYTPILKGGTSNYYVGIEGISINGKLLPISSNDWKVDPNSGNGGTIIDSGTSLTFFTNEAYAVIMKALSAAITYPTATTEDPTQFDLCFKIAGVGKLKMPRISIIFSGGKKFSPPPRNYVLVVEEGVGCVGFKSISAGSPNIIGNLLQQNFFFQYDVQRSLLGFAPAYCLDHN